MSWTLDSSDAQNGLSLQILRWGNLSNYLVPFESIDTKIGKKMQAKVSWLGQGTIKKMETHFLLVSIYSE